MGAGKHGKAKTIAAATEDLVLVCAKCLKKCKGGFGPDGDMPLDRALTQAAAAVTPPDRKPFKGGRKRNAPLMVVPVKCLGICPGRAVMAIGGTRPGAWVAVPRGMPVGAIAQALGLACSARLAAPAGTDPQTARVRDDGTP